MITGIGDNPVTIEAQDENEPEIIDVEDKNG
jgi:hypothetical protein